MTRALISAMAAIVVLCGVSSPIQAERANKNTGRLVVYYLRCAKSTAKDMRLYVDDLLSHRTVLTREDATGITGSVSIIRVQLPPGVYSGFVASGDCGDAFLARIEQGETMSVTALGDEVARLDGGIGVVTGTLPFAGAHVSVVYDLRWGVGSYGYGGSDGRVEIPAQTAGRVYWVGGLANGNAWLRIRSSSLSSFVDIPIGKLKFDIHNRVTTVNVTEKMVGEAESKQSHL